MVDVAFGDTVVCGRVLLADAEAFVVVAFWLNGISNEDCIVFFFGFWISSYSLDVKLEFGYSISQEDILAMIKG